MKSNNREDMYYRRKGIALFVVAVLFIAAIMVVTCLIIDARSKEYQSLINNRFEKLVSLIIEENPELDTSKLAKIMNDTNIDSRQVLLEKYGIYFDDVDTINGFKDVRNKAIKQIFILFVCAAGIICILNIYFAIRRHNKVKEIINYIEKIYNKEYNLCITDNSESDFSRLKNELYKIVVLLKEQTDISNEEKDNLNKSVADISHQLKTPLTSISIMLDNIIDNPNMKEETRKKFLREISREINWVNWLVISLLKLAKFDANVVEFSKDNIDVNNLISDVIMNLEIPIEIKNIDIKINTKNEDETDIHRKDVTYEGDYKWNVEALTNIVKNCIEHSEDGGRIWIDFEKNNLYTKIIIEDEGCGMSKEDERHVFERFYRGQNASENSIGIGLALAKTIIERDQGYIICKSRDKSMSVKTGTIFEIKLPTSII